MSCLIRRGGPTSSAYRDDEHAHSRRTYKHIVWFIVAASGTVGASVYYNRLSEVGAGSHTYTWEYFLWVWRRTSSDCMRYVLSKYIGRVGRFQHKQNAGANNDRWILRRVRFLTEHGETMWFDDNGISDAKWEQLSSVPCGFKSEEPSLLQSQLSVRMHAESSIESARDTWKLWQTAGKIGSLIVLECQKASAYWHIGRTFGTQMHQNIKSHKRVDQ